MISICKPQVPSLTAVDAFAGVLLAEHALMQSLVERHFPTSRFVLAWYMGYIHDLTVVWTPEFGYTAAHTALWTYSLGKGQVRKAAQAMSVGAKELSTKLNLVLELPASQITAQAMARPMQAAALICRCNSTLRWLMLHATTEEPKAKKIIAEVCGPPNWVLQLLLRCSLLEFTLMTHLDINVYAEFAWATEILAHPAFTRPLAKLALQPVCSIVIARFALLLVKLPARSSWW
eukprot:SAG31_NODE_878_length_11297_cov_3.770714_7_plen_233_part_00